jgi:hypothetical protein
MAVDTLSKAFWRSVEQQGEKPALLVKREKQYRPITYTELGRRVYALARALHELGVRKGRPRGNPRRKLPRMGNHRLGNAVSGRDYRTYLPDADRPAGQRNPTRLGAEGAHRQR